MRILPLLSLFLSSCGLPWGIGGQEGEDHDPGSSDTGHDGDADTDTDTDTDSDTNPDSGDTASDGPWTGPFLLDGTDADGVTDRCTGLVELWVDGAELMGTAGCWFAGPLAPAFPDGIAGNVRGTVAGDGSVTGLLLFRTGATGDVEWTGTATDTIVVGTFAGETDGATPLTVSGSFDAARP